LRALPRGAPEGRRLRDLALSTGLTEPTVRRILRALMHEQFVIQDETTRLYRIGPLASELALASSFHADVVTKSRAALTRLAELSGDSVYLALRTGIETVCLDRADGSFPIRAEVVQVGQRRLLGLGTGGVVLLAALPDTEIEEMLSAPAYRAADVGLDEVRTRVAGARSLGYSDITDRPIPGVRAVGIAVPGGARLPSLAVSVTAVASRLTDSHVAKVLPMMRDAAATIAAQFETREA
jgi:DNA-binding IclR family transcriptional regulator